MAVVSVYPDSAFLRRHIDVGGPESKKLRALPRASGVEVFGCLSERAVELVQPRALLGKGAVTLHEPPSGFERIEAPSHL